MAPPKQFGILSPVLGLSQNIPSVLLNEAFHEDNLNVLLRHGGVERAQKPEKELVDGSLDLVAPADGNPFLLYHFFEKSDGTKFLLGFTKDNIYHWNTSTTQWDRKHVCGSSTGTDASCTDWSVCTFRDKVIATNGVDTNSDKVLYWDGSLDTFRNLSESSKYSTGTVTLTEGNANLEGAGTEFITSDIEAGDMVYIVDSDRAYYVSSRTDADTLVITPAAAESLAGKAYVIIENNGLEYDTGVYLTKAKFAWNFENRIILGYTFKNSNTFPSGIDWCSQSDEDDWVAGDSGAAVFDGADYLTGAGQYQDRLIVFKSESVHALWLVISDLIFNAAKIKANLGTFSPHSIVNGANGELFFLATDKTIRVIRGMASMFPRVSEPLWEAFWEIPDEYFIEVRSHWVRRFGHALWAIPSGAEQTTNNLLCILDEFGRWTKMDTAVRAFGRYRRQAGCTIDTIPYPTIDERGWG